LLEVAFAPIVEDGVAELRAAYGTYFQKLNFETKITYNFDFIQVIWAKNGITTRIVANCCVRRRTCHALLCIVGTVKCVECFFRVLFYYYLIFGLFELEYFVLYKLI